MGRFFNSSLSNKNDFRLLRNVFRRCPKAFLTIEKNNFSSQGSVKFSLRCSRSTPLFTFGGGLNTLSETEKRYSAS